MNADAGRHASPHPPTGASKAGKKRVRNFTADDRAAHREFEKGRRKAFRERLIELASHVPALSTVEPQRLSKHVVVEESISRHEHLEASCVDALGMIRALTKEREELLAEVNTWRAGAGLPLREHTVDSSAGRLATLEDDTQHHPRIAYHETATPTPEPHADYQTMPIPSDQPHSADHMSEVVSAAHGIDKPQLSENELLTMALEAPWSTMDADGAPMLFSTAPFPDASHQHQSASMSGELSTV